MDKSIQVQKRDGRYEPFEPEKIARVVTAAGLTDQESQTLSRSVANWVNHRRKPSITSLHIRDKVLEELKNVNTYAANLFEWYQKTKEPQERKD